MDCGRRAGCSCPEPSPARAPPTSGDGEERVGRWVSLPQNGIVEMLKREKQEGWRVDRGSETTAERRSPGRA